MLFFLLMLLILKDTYYNIYIKRYINILNTMINTQKDMGYSLQFIPNNHDIRTNIYNQVEYIFYYFLLHKLGNYQKNSHKIYIIHYIITYLSHYHYQSQVLQKILQIYWFYIEEGSYLSFYMYCMPLKNHILYIEDLYKSNNLRYFRLENDFLYIHIEVGLKTYWILHHYMNHNQFHLNKFCICLDIFHMIKSLGSIRRDKRGNFLEYHKIRNQNYMVIYMFLLKQNRQHILCYYILYIIKFIQIN